MMRKEKIFRFGNKTIKITLGDVIAFKAILTVGILAVHFLPGQFAVPVTIATNMLWLWRGS